MTDIHINDFETIVTLILRPMYRKNHKYIRLNTYRHVKLVGNVTNRGNINTNSNAYGETKADVSTYTGPEKVSLISVLDIAGEARGPHQVRLDILAHVIID